MVTNSLSIVFENSLKPEGRSILLSSGQLFLSGHQSTGLTWTSDIKPLADKFCAGCHGASGPGRFSNAGDEASWLSSKELVLGRLENSGGMSAMPPTYSQLQMTEVEKGNLIQWLKAPQVSVASDDPKPDVGNMQMAVAPVQIPPLNWSKFAPLNVLSTLVVSDLVFASKSGPNKSVFSMADGSALVLDESTGVLSSRKAVVQAPTVNSKIYLLDENSGWIISDDTVQNFFPDGAAVTDRLNVTVLSVPFDTRQLIPLHVSPKLLVLKSNSGLRIFSRSNQVVSVESLDEIPELNAALPSAIAAGFGPEKSFLWVASTSKILFFKNSPYGFLRTPQSSKFVSGLVDGVSFEKLVLELDKEMLPSGRILYLSGGRFVASSQSVASARWLSEIKPLADKYCATCHSGTGPGTFSRAGEEMSWIGSRTSILSRLSSAVAPMPPASALQLADIEKSALSQWLQESSGSDSNGGGGTGEPSDPATHVLPPIALQFARRDALAKLEPFAGDVVFVSKQGMNKALFSMSTGGAYLYDEPTEFVEYLPPVVQPPAGSKTIRLDGNTGWVVSSNKLDYFFPDSANANVLRVLSATFNSSALTLLHTSSERLIFKSATGLRIVTPTSDGTLSVESLEGIPELAAILPQALISGLGPQRAFLWVATSSKVLFFKNSQYGFLKTPQSAEFSFGLTGGTVLDKLSIEFDDKMKPIGRIVYILAGKINVSGYAPAAAALSWEVDIRPIAEQFCLACHGESGAGGFSKANESASWTGFKRDSIIARVFEQKSMPPTYTQASKDMTDAQRTKIRDWLSLGSGTTTTTTPTSGATPVPSATPAPMVTPTTPTPGATWTNVVQPIMAAQCTRCHTTYSDFPTVYSKRIAILQRVGNFSMPQSPSSITVAERDAILNYLRGFP
jgi:mono/diheme cytochrome c family protein